MYKQHGKLVLILTCLYTCHYNIYNLLHITWDQIDGVNLVMVDVLMQNTRGIILPGRTSNQGKWVRRSIDTDIILSQFLPQHMKYPSIYPSIFNSFIPLGVSDMWSIRIFIFWLGQNWL